MRIIPQLIAIASAADVFQQCDLDFSTAYDLIEFPNLTFTGPLSDKFLPQLNEKPNLEVATIAAGCFWGVENIYRKYFCNKGIVDLEVGYSGGDTENPTYKEVCSNTTNHAEALQILYDPEIVSYEQLIEFFFKMHDPTTKNRQGPDDFGSQYRSEIFTLNERQHQIAIGIKRKMQKTFWSSEIVTEVTPLKNWYGAEEYHQMYLLRNPEGYECPTHYLRERGD